MEEEDPHEIIKQRQIKGSLKYKNKKPSRFKKVYWIYAVRQSGFYPKSTKFSGKFVFFCNPNEVNDIWFKIKLLTEKGFLGDSSKVSTKSAYKARKNQKKNIKDIHVICIYTYSNLDSNDKDNIKKNILKIVNNKEIFYKTNEKTMSELNINYNIHKNK